MHFLVQPIGDFIDFSENLERADVPGSEPLACMGLSQVSGSQPYMISWLILSTLIGHLGLHTRWYQEDTVNLSDTF